VGLPPKGVCDNHCSHHAPTPCRCSLLRLLRVILCQDRSQPPSGRRWLLHLPPGPLEGEQPYVNLAAPLTSLFITKNTLSSLEMSCVVGQGECLRQFSITTKTNERTPALCARHTYTP
jgi:hypothetical protein